MGPPESEGAPGQEQGPDRALRGARLHEYQKRNETAEIFIRSAGLGNEVIEFVNVSKAFGDRC